MSPTLIRVLVVVIGGTLALCGVWILCHWFGVLPVLAVALTVLAASIAIRFRDALLRLLRESYGRHAERRTAKTEEQQRRQAERSVVGVARPVHASSQRKPSTKPRKSGRELAPITHFYTKVAGVTYENRDGNDRQRIIRRCRYHEQLVIEHEHDNP